MKKLLCLAIVLVLTASLCACSKDDDNTSVKLPEGATSKVAMTYEEAIKPFELDESYKKLFDRETEIITHIMSINAFYSETARSITLESGKVIDTSDGIDDSLTALEEFFKSEKEYTDYAKKLSNPMLKDSYLKFIDLAKETYQEFLDNPTKSVTEKTSTSITTLEMYYLNTALPTDISKPEDYLSIYTSIVYQNLEIVEAYCKLTPKEIIRLIAGAQETSYDQRMQMLTAMIDNIPSVCSAEGLELDYVISNLDALMGLKNNAYAIAVEAYGSDSQKLDAYEDFINQATELYNTVRIHRPEFNDTEYIEKQKFDLDKLDKYVHSN